MFDVNLCNECLCHECLYDYGLEYSNFPCLCKDREHGACQDCKKQDKNNVVDNCCYHES